MVTISGFAAEEERLIRALADRFAADGFRLGRLDRIERADLPGYYGLVTPTPDAAGRLRCLMQLAAPHPFTIVHELAHVSDIETRHEATRLHMAAGQPIHWHLAHRMTSEYYANRVACAYCDEEAVFAAFKNDRLGLVASVPRADWAGLLIHYALLLGLFHGLGREDVEPLELLPDPAPIPDSALQGIVGFRREIGAFFRDYDHPPKLCA